MKDQTDSSTKATAILTNLARNGPRFTRYMQIVRENQSLSVCALPVPVFETCLIRRISCAFSARTLAIPNQLKGRMPGRV
ncbi:hypothetical protein BaRGS_00001649 [Batillaria attramentaria]|uniref:Uncharacterized protein n=1 Tax=Batillaria attramentaria TaxID=370345 RepID=A0ABD0M4Y5_9CAEN